MEVTSAGDAVEKDACVRRFEYMMFRDILIVPLAVGVS